MGNNPSKNDSLPNSATHSMSGSSAPDGDLDDESAPPLSRATGNGSDMNHDSKVSPHLKSNTTTTTPKLPTELPTTPQNIPARPRALPKKHRRSSPDYNLEIDASAAVLLNGLLLPSQKWNYPHYHSHVYGSSAESLKSGDLSVSPMFTTENKDESLVLSVSSITNSPTKVNPFLLLQLENSLDPIVEASAESTPEPRKSRALKSPSSVAKSSDLGHKLVSKVTSKSPSSVSPPLLPSGKKSDFDLDGVIDRLLAIGMRKSSGASSKRRSKDKLPMTSQEIKYILSKARTIFLEQPTLLKLAPPVKIVGDIHGQFHDLIRIFNSCGYPPHTNYLFLGDYVDRGHKSLETILLLLCYKVKYPENFFMLRGNHESANITKIYGFYDECKRRLPLISGSHKLWKNFVDVFNSLPIAATINDKIFCIHGGLSPDLRSLKQIEQIQRPTDIPDKGLLADLLWSDPDPQVKTYSASNWPKNDRGVSYCFGRKHVDHFLATFNMDLIVRGHMVVEDGYEFFNKRKLVTVFLAPNYCGEFNNYGAIMGVDTSMCCSFELLKPQ